MQKRKNLIIFIYIIAGIICCSVGAFGIYYYNFSNKPPKVVSQKPVTKKKKDKKKEVVEIYNSPVPGLVDTYSNTDIVAQLQIPSVNFSYPVAMTYNNNFYLNHDFYKRESKLGAIYIDYRTGDINEAKQINIYAHNSNYYILPFKVLENYQDQNFFTNNNDIYLYTDKQELHYKVFSVRIITNEDEHMIIDFNDDKEFLSHVASLRENSMFDTNEKIVKTDKLLILQTCLYNPEGRKILVMGKLVSDKK